MVWRAADEFAKAGKVEAEIHDSGGPGSNDQYTELIDHATRAAQHAPGDVVYHFYLSAFRWQAVARLRDANGEVYLTPASRNVVRQIVDELLETRRLCPTYGPVHLMAGQIQADVLHDSTAAAPQLHHAFQVAQCDSTACLADARLDADAGRWDVAQEKLRRYLALFGSYSQAATLCLDGGHPEVALRLADGDVGRLGELAQLSDKRGADPKLAANARLAAAHVLEEQAAKPNASAETLVKMAQRCAAEGNAAAVARYYRRAIALDYARVDWHVALAHALADQGLVDDAMSEARLCLRLSPQSDEARRLIVDLDARPQETPPGGNDREQ
jgi:hypothetical protein